MSHERGNVATLSAPLKPTNFQAVAILFATRISHTIHAYIYISTHKHIQLYTHRTHEQPDNRYVLKLPASNLGPGALQALSELSLLSARGRQPTSSVQLVGRNEIRIPKESPAEPSAFSLQASNKKTG